jgi:aspartyl-tRNA(Asn)/glutamyl-tRNA(Gln) amidotransferase subunit A
VEGAIRWFTSEGATRVDIELPNVKLGVPVYYVIAPAEASSNLSRFDGVRYGHRASEYSDLVDMYARTRAEGFGAEVKRRILVGTYVLSHGYYDAYYLQAQKVRRLIVRDFQSAFERCDLILGPVAPTTAFEIGAQVQDPVKMYLGDIFTVPGSLAGLPGLSIPCGFDEAGLPVGLQLTGTYFSEANLLAAAHRYQQATDWHLRVPTETPL